MTSEFPHYDCDDKLCDFDVYNALANTFIAIGRCLTILLALVRMIITLRKHLFISKFSLFDGTSPDNWTCNYFPGR